MNCLRSLPAFAGSFLELNDVHWVLRSTNVFFKVSIARHFYDESAFIVASLSPSRGQSFLFVKQYIEDKVAAECYYNLTFRTLFFFVKKIILKIFNSSQQYNSKIELNCFRNIVVN